MGQFLDTSLIEPEALKLDAPHATVVAYSTAISLKRIADALAGGDIFTGPVNSYGENFTDAIQNSFVRGQRGIHTDGGY